MSLNRIIGTPHCTLKWTRKLLLPSIFWGSRSGTDLFAVRSGGVLHEHGIELLYIGDPYKRVCIMNKALVDIICYGSRSNIVLCSILSGSKTYVMMIIICLCFYLYSDNKGRLYNGSHYTPFCLGKRSLQEVICFGSRSNAKLCSILSGIKIYTMKTVCRYFYLCSLCSINFLYTWCYCTRFCLVNTYYIVVICCGSRSGSLYGILSRSRICIMIIACMWFCYCWWYFNSINTWCSYIGCCIVKHFLNKLICYRTRSNAESCNTSSRSRIYVLISTYLYLHLYVLLVCDYQQKFTCYESKCDIIIGQLYYNSKQFS